MKTLPFIALTLFMWGGAVFSGYFFETAYLGLNAFAWGAMLLCWRSAEIRPTPLLWMVALFTLSYWLTCIFAIDPESAILEAARVSSLLPLAVLFGLLSQDARASFLRQWPWCGAFLTLWGIAFGLYRDGRLESTFGYANVFAAFLLCGILEALRSYRDTRKATFMALAAVQTFGLVLTGSRSTLAFAVVALGVVGYRAFRRRKARNVALAGAGAAVIATAGWLALPSSVVMRLTEWTWRTPELDLRRVYWTDAVELIRSHLFTGLGGGGWAISTSGYFVKYVHQHYLQIALDAGVVGLLVFLLLATHAVRSGIHGRCPRTIPALVLLAHAAVDLDLTYPLVFGLLIVLFVEMERSGHRSDSQASPPLRPKPALIAVSLCITGCFAWGAIGYGIISANAGRFAIADPEATVRRLHVAENMLPWSHVVQYELAAGYMELYKATRKADDAANARMHAARAYDLLPESDVYQKMADSSLQIISK